MRSIYTLFCCMVMFLTSSQLSATSFDVVNTGSNMTVFIIPGATMSGDVADVSEIGIFYTNDSGDLVCAGASPFSNDGSPFQITLWGSEQDEDNGMAALEAFTWLAKSADDVIYDVTASYLVGSPIFVDFGYTSIDSMEFTLPTATVSGCTDSTAFNFNELATESDDSCVPVVSGCTDTVATNYDSSANTAGDCTYAPTTATVSFTVDMNGVEQPSAEYDNVVVNGSWNGWQGWGVTLADADADGIYTGSLEVEPNTTFEYVVAVTGSADNWSGWGIQWGDGCANANVFATSGEISSVTASSLTPGCSEILGCMDANASNYDSTATQQSEDTYGNLLCLYASCDDIPEYGCIYADSYSPFTADFGADACAGYGGTPCEEPTASPLFFSEYAEGSASNKYLEIYNPTSETVDLAGYAFSNVSNAPAIVGVHEYWNTFTEGASIAPGDVYVIAHGSSDPAILAEADQNYTYLSNGDDGFALVYGSEPNIPVDAETGGYTIVDFAGDWNGDPGSGWSVAGVSNATQNHTLVRKCSVEQGNADWTASAGTSAEDSEWIVLEIDDWSDLGSHTTPCPDVILGCTDEAASNFNSTATEDDGSCEYLGCTDETAVNFDASAVTDDGSCIYPLDPMVNLFISEYSEGSSSNKYLEIYNPTADTVSLASYAWPSVSNAPSTVGAYEYWNSFASGAQIAPYGVYVVANPGSDLAILNYADETGTVYFNGDDGYALVYGFEPSSPSTPEVGGYVILDIVGDWNGDPGS
ncbi:MAG: lamin tail domain-containing protein, partial [Flavobacteriales bacterium]|nr:lamin tail domain-containing protein [Flavobacteriales bacterium]